MKQVPPCLVATALACGLGLAPAAAAAAPEPAHPLVVQVDFVVPEYKGGDKFRSPPTIDTALAEELARRLQLPLQTVAAASWHSPVPGYAAAGGGAALRLTALRDLSSVPEDTVVVPIGYRAVPMAIMRSDTTIKRWEQLEGRKVCMAAGGSHVGAMTRRYGAEEQVHPSATDALVALREGACDAMVHDSTFLEELIRYPEWKKFSARLRGNQRSTLAFLVPARDETKVRALRQLAFDWDAQGFPQQLVKKTVRDIAFEVYLEQDVPDCH